MADENLQQPSKGRIVLVRSKHFYDGQEYPAVVVQTHRDHAVDVHIFAPISVMWMGQVPHESRAEELQSNESWRWPPRM